MYMNVEIWSAEDKNKILFIFQAEEKSDIQRSTTAKLKITVLPEDTSPPILHVSSKVPKYTP